MALVTLQTIFQDAFPAYEQTHPLPAHVRRAARAIMQCRTAALGGHVQACPDGHMARIWYNSCRHRACPQCAYLQTERWLAFQQARLLACDHYHVIFTLPHELNPLWLANVPVMTTLLFQAVRDTLGTLLADPKYLGAQPGIIAALHTWSQTLVLHPHLHCLVTGGGLTPAGQWVAVRHGFLLPARVVMAVFRGKMVAAIRQTLARGALALPAADAAAAGAQPPEPPGPPDEDEVECADHGALSPRGRRGHVSGAVPAGRPAQERPPGGVRRRLRHLHLSRAAGGGRRGARLSPTDDVARGGLSAAVAPPCPGAPDAGACGRMGCTIPATLRPWPSVVRSLASRRWRRQPRWTGRRCVRSGGKPIRSGVPPVASGSCAPGSSRAGVRPRRYGLGSARHEADPRQAAGGERSGVVVCLAVARWCPSAGRDAVWGAQRARSAHCGPAGEAVRACGRREGVGVPRPKLHSASEHPVSGRIRTRSVQPSAIRSAQGRA